MSWDLDYRKNFLEKLKTMLRLAFEEQEKTLISEFVKSIEKRIEKIEYNGYDPLLSLKNLKSEWE